MTSYLFRVGVVLLGLTLTGAVCSAQEAAKPAIVELFEDDAAELLKKFNNPGGDGGEGHVEKKVVFSGTTSIKIIPMQRYSPRIPGWSHKIVEKPGPGEYRYLRFAWKADGCAGIMVQFHAHDWFMRYTAGVDRHGWGTKFVADKPPSEWVVVTVDLFKDYGTHTLTGMALTAFEGQAAYFDHIYFGRTIEDLDRIDATGLRKGKLPVPTEGELNEYWAALAGNDASLAYRAFWTLVAAQEQAVPFLRQKLTAPKTTVTVTQLKRWLAELDANGFATREKATWNLGQHLQEAAALLEEELTHAPSLEVKCRIERLLAQRKKGDPEQERLTKAIRALEYAATAPARKCLEELAQAANHPQVQVAARAALQRLQAAPK